MMKLERPAETPECIRGKEAELGERFRQRRVVDRGCAFSWGQHEKVPRNHGLLLSLKEMTTDHCSFCDGYPFDMSKETIEHFRPKSLFPELAYTWNNLFYACDRCQEEKGEKFDDLLLKPDSTDYTFSRYFMVDYRTGELAPNPTASDTDQQRAQITIACYGLNIEARNTSRRRTIKEMDRVRRDDGQLSPLYLETINYRFLAFDLP